MRTNWKRSVSLGVPVAVSHGLSPLLLVSTLALFVCAQHQGWDLATVFVWLSGARILVLLLVERQWPAKLAWQMTWPSFLRDLKYMALNGGVAGLLKLCMVWWALDVSRFNTGWLSGMPVWAELVVLVLVYEFFQYVFHRWSHEGRGRLGAWLWRIHVAHHLPDRVYLLMHPVGHPLNLLITLALIQLPWVVLGAKHDTVFLFNALIAQQGLLSHFNVDVKAGWLNYVLVGTQLHRLHHSADLQEAQNFGVLTPFWDLVFGTFVYGADKMPEKTGVSNPENYPDSNEWVKVLRWPWPVTDKGREDI